LLLLFVAIYVPIFSEILDVVAPTREGWMLILVLSLFPLAAGRIFKRFMKI
jgi:P-type Ca2+ transporter type 2C